MELNEFALSAETAQNHKMPDRSLLKSHGSNIDQIVGTVSSKDQEFIDHTLLAPEYIRESNNFIMDLMDQQVVFPKQTNDRMSMEKEPMITELQFQNAMMHFVNKHGSITCASTNDVGIVESSVNSISFDKVHANFMTLNENFKGSADSVNNKAFCSSNDETVVSNQYDHLANTSLANAIYDLTRPNKETMDHCGIISDVTMELPPGSLISDQDLICSHLNAKKILPHKKRISKKLKVNQNNFGYSLPAEDSEAKDLENRLVEQNVLQFSCEICGHNTSSQLDFFAHLKLHYEPAPPDPMLPVMKDTLNDLQQINHNDSNRLRDKGMVDHVSVDQVFPDVHINFEDFQPADVTVQQQLNQPNRDDDMKILNSNSIDKCIQYVTQSEVEPPPKHVSSDEIEFSDTEDMLEGIRNVVDKVSIEDTCDALDMVTSPSIRAPWFSLNTFNCISLKSLESSNFATTINNNDLPIPKIIETSSNVEENAMLFKTQNQNCASLTNEKLASCVNEADQIFSLTELATTKPVNVSSDINKQMHRTSIDLEVKTEPEEDDDDDDDDEEGGEIDDDDGILNLKRQVFPCRKCSRDFNSNNALKYHDRTHTGIRAHKCQICDKSFYAQGALKSHLKTHTDEKPYRCEICNTYFRQMGDVKYHMASKHNKEKAYQCEFCGKAFARQYSLVLHRRIHTNERNYKCEYCPKSFRASIYLQNHTKIHTGEKPYTCVICSKKFRVSGDLRRHSKTHQRKNAKSDS